MDDRIKMALVGLNFGGHIAERDIFDGFGGDWVQVVGACDLDLCKSEEYGTRHGIKVYDDLNEILNDSTIDAIGLFTPPSGRANLIRQCIRAGKHVMTTKPFELDPDEALSVLYEAKEAGIVIHLNSPGPLPAADVAKINEWREQYDLGQPIAARWETYARYRETENGTWYDSPEKCPVAPIFRLGIYGINELIKLLGVVHAVQVTHSKIFTRRPTPDNAELTMQFENGAIGSVFASLCIGDGQLHPAALTLHYENGTIIKRQIKDISTSDFKSVEMNLKCTHNEKFIEESYEFSPEFRSGAYQWKNFYEAIRDGAKAKEISPEKVAMGIAVIKAMREAEQSGAAVKISDSV